jgi:hypothetical protein
MDQAELAHRVEVWSSVILERGLVERWVNGAIWPCEMAYFLGQCDVHGVREIVESGRQDGYSTLLLGIYGQSTGARIRSIDLEIDEARAKRCREALKGYEVDLLVGDAWELIGRAVQETDRPLALLVDGPKNWSAMSILFAASAWPHVRLIAMDNLDPPYTTRAYFSGMAGAPVFYEEAVPRAGPAWAEIKRRSHEHRYSIAPPAFGPESMLGAMTARAELARALHNRFRTYQPLIVRWAWSTGRYRLLRRIIALTMRFGGPEKYMGQRSSVVAG